jgi:nicotinate phosphoribosyltransferase
VATNVYRTLRAARGKPILFFPARFDLPATQASDGYAYHIAVQRYNHETGLNLPSLASTDAQGSWWGGRGVGTVAHAYILSFLRDTAAAMLEFARLMPLEVKRIALVDTNNDCVGDSLATARAMFAKYRELKRAGAEEEAEKFVLFGVRPDTASNLRDVCLEPFGTRELDCGVNPRLVWALRRALDAEPARLFPPPPPLGVGPGVGSAEEQAEAERYFRSVKIIVTGGFTVDRIERFETLGVPADMYGVGSSYFSGETNDFTADVVRVKIDGVWHDLAKVGRGARANPALERVEWSG